MRKKWFDLQMKAYLAGTGFVQKLRDFKNDERGLSGVVVAVLLILVAVLAVAMIWGFLSGWLGEMWEKIVNAGSTIEKVK